MHGNRDIGLISGSSCVSPAKPQARARSRELLPGPPAFLRPLKQPLCCPRGCFTLPGPCELPWGHSGPLLAQRGVAAGSPQSHRPEPRSPLSCALGLPWRAWWVPWVHTPCSPLIPQTHGEQRREENSEARLGPERPKPAPQAPTSSVQA